jgi:hypothetical protein
LQSDRPPGGGVVQSVQPALPDSGNIAEWFNDEVQIQNLRHGRACPGHPRLSYVMEAKTWMPATSAGMTELVETA